MVETEPNLLTLNIDLVNFLDNPARGTICQVLWCLTNQSCPASRELTDDKRTVCKNYKIFSLIDNQKHIITTLG